MSRPKSAAHLYADELGIPYRRMVRMGGEKRLRAMSPGALALLLKPGPVGNSQTVHRGGLAARGMKPFTTGYIIQPHFPTDKPIELLATDEILEGTHND